MNQDIDRVLIPSERIQARVREMAGEITSLYDPIEPELTLVPILSGSIIFLADLIRHLPLKMKLALVHVSTYPGRAMTAGDTRTILQPTGEIDGRHVLLIDDILDSGRTLRRVQGMIQELRPASLRTAVLLRKPAKAPSDVPVEFVGFDVDDLFVVGYGLDFDDHYRNFPHIGVLRREVTA